VGDFITAARKVGLKAGLSTHYGRHWAYYTIGAEYDNWDPEYEGLYGDKRADNDPPRPEDEQQWENVMTELIDNYRPGSGKFTIKSLSSKHPVGADGIKSISMLGSKESIRWNETEDGLTLRTTSPHRSAAAKVRRQR
jgi:hypothetical protein